MRIGPDSVLRAFGEDRSLLDWAGDERCAPRPDVLVWRLRLGWEPEKALTTPEPGERRHSRFRGVTWDKFTSSWKAQIATRPGVRALGRFAGRVGELMAAMAHDREARCLFGDDAELNFP